MEYLGKGAVVEFTSPLGGSEPTPKRSRFFRISLFAALISLIGTTFALNIQLNDNDSFEYGQGLYRITSCDQFVGIDLGSSSTTPYSDGLSRVKNIRLQGLDVGRCANTSIRIRLYDNSNADPMELFTNPSYYSNGVTYPCCTDTGTAVILVFAANATQSTALASTTLISPSGKNINKGDRAQSLSYNTTTGIFTIAFNTPLAIMQKVARTTLESASNV
jgi:hypothetical protein